MLAKQANLFEDLAIYIERINYSEAEGNTKLSGEQSALSKQRLNRTYTAYSER